MKEIVPTFDAYLTEGGHDYIPNHGKCKSRMERKLLSINDLRAGDLYMIVRDAKNSEVWTDGWKYEGQDKENNDDVFKFKSANDLYDVKELTFKDEDMEHLVFQKKIAKQKV